MAGPFRSFWLAGFESSCQINGAGARLDLQAATEHDRRAAEDYARLAPFGVRAVREGMRWYRIDRGRELSFESVRPLADAADAAGIQIVWTLFHYGWPDDLSLFAPRFIGRFARYCRAAARFVADRSDEVPVYAPVNEISFLAWAGGEVGYMHPHVRGQGARVKEQLVRAAIEGMEAIWSVDPRARFLHCDPLIHVVSPVGRPHLARAAADACAAQYEAWDMLAGGLRPELGGHPRYLDLIGANFYHANQWEYPDQRLRWEDEPRDPRWMPLRDLLRGLYHRYHRPIVLAETSHFGDGRPRWIREVAREVRAAMDQGTRMAALCLYPAIDRPDWDNDGHWHNSGLWDLCPGSDGRLDRVVCQSYAAEIHAARQFLPAEALDC